MKKLLAMLLIACCGVAARAANDHDKLNDRLEAARGVLESIMSVPDKAIPDGIARNAKCIAVVPGVVKGAFIVGAEYGQGVVTCRTHHGWSGPVFIRLAGGSFGFQIGGQGTDLVLVATNDKGFQDFCMTSSRSAPMRRQQPDLWDATHRLQPTSACALKC